MLGGMVDQRFDIKLFSGPTTPK